jgi:hypothetical protein
MFWLMAAGFLLLEAWQLTWAIVSINIPALI